MIFKDHKGICLAPPFSHGEQTKIVPGKKDAMSKVLWDLWILSSGKTKKQK